MSSSPQKHRLRWTGDLEKTFNEVVDKLGGINVATPQAVVDKLKENYPGLTTSHVKSHLQHIRNKTQAQLKRKHQVRDNQINFYKNNTENGSIRDESETMVLEGSSGSDQDNDGLLQQYINGLQQDDSRINKEIFPFQNQSFDGKPYHSPNFNVHVARQKIITEKIQICQNVDLNDTVKIEFLKNSVKQLIFDLQQNNPGIQEALRGHRCEKFSLQLVPVSTGHPLKEEIQQLVKIFIFYEGRVFIQTSWDGNKENQTNDKEKYSLDGYDRDSYLAFQEISRKYPGLLFDFPTSLKHSQIYEDEKNQFDFRKTVFNNKPAFQNPQFNHNHLKSNLIPSLMIQKGMQNLHLPTPTPSFTPTPNLTPTPTPTPSPSPNLTPTPNSDPPDFQQSFINGSQK